MNQDKSKQLKTSRFSTDSASLDSNSANTDVTNSFSQLIAEREYYKEELNKINYAVSHDLRAPLKTINAFVELIYEDFQKELPDGIADYLGKVKNAGIKLEYMIAGLMSLLKISKMEFTRRQVNINNIVAQLIPVFSGKYPDVNVNVEIEPELQTQGDEDLIYLLYQQLLDNAWKFSSSQPDPRIRIGKGVKANNKTFFYIADNGIGFDAKITEKLFTPFCQINSNNPLQGIGVGLATAHRIISRHGGDIWPESVIGNGARFNFSFSA